MRIPQIITLLISGFVSFSVVAQANSPLFSSAITLPVFVFAYGLLGYSLFPKYPKTAWVVVIFTFWPYLIGALSWMDNDLIFPLYFPGNALMATSGFWLGRMARLASDKGRMRIVAVGMSYLVVVAVCAQVFVPGIFFRVRMHDIQVQLGQERLRGLNTTDIQLADLKGKVAVFDFWSVHCVPCRRSRPEFLELAEMYRGNPSVFVASVSSSRFDRQEAVDSSDFWSGSRMPEFYDSTGEFTSKVGIRGTPGIVLVDPDGVARYLHEAFEPEIHGHYADLISKRIELLLAEMQENKN